MRAPLTPRQAPIPQPQFRDTRTKRAPRHVRRTTRVLKCSTPAPALSCATRGATCACGSAQQQFSSLCCTSSQRCHVNDPHPTHTTVLVLRRRGTHTRYVTVPRWGGERTTAVGERDLSMARVGVGRGRQRSRVRRFCVMSEMMGRLNAARRPPRQHPSKPQRSNWPQRWGAGGAVGRMVTRCSLNTHDRCHMGWAVAAAPLHDTWRESEGVLRLGVAQVRS